jgi:phosphate transport system substrate-binding protein
MTLKIFKNIMFSIAIISLGIISIGCSRETSKKVVVKGSTTVLPITQRAAEAFKEKHGISVSIEGSGSGNGIKALIDGTTDIANSSREMKDKEVKMAQEKGIKTKEIVCAYDMIIPVVHPSNPLKNITIDQLKAIYDGSITNWKKLGGKDEIIVVISRDTSSGTYEVWHEKVMSKSDVRRDALLQASNGAILSAVAGNPKAIGYIGFGYINNSIKPLMINGIEGTIANGKSGRYPIFRKLYMYFNEERLSSEARDFIDFILSAEGQKLVKDTGYIPL